MLSPSLETLSNEVVGKAFELFVSVFHLVVLRVENDTLLDLLDVLLGQDVVANAQLLNAEVRLESVSNAVATTLRNAAVKDFKLYQSLMATNKIGNSLSSFFTQV